MVSLRDIAREAGVSIKTVSNILNGRNKELWPDSIQRSRRIRAIASRLGYRPNQAARAMRIRKTCQIGVLMPSIRNPTSAHVAETLNEVLDAHGYKMLLGLTESQNKRIHAYLGGFANGMVDGVINADPLVNDRMMVECLGALPHVIWNRESPTAASAQDYAADIYQSLTHLWDLGHRRVGLLSAQAEDVGSSMRREHFRQFFLEKGIGEVEQRIALLPNWDFRDVSPEIETLLAAGCTAIVGGNDVFAAAAVHALHALHFAVPADVSVIGFDDSLAAMMCVPRLTTMRRPVRELCHGAIDAILSQIEGHPPAPFCRIPSELVVRGTTGPVRPQR